MSDIAVTDRELLPASAGVTRQPNLLVDSATMIVRSLRLSRRNVEVLLTSLILPVILMLLFVYLFGGAIDTGTEYVSYVVPGVLVLCAGFGSATTAISVSQDMHNGIMDRFRSLDVSGAAVVCGHVAASVVRNAASTVLVFGVAFAIGFRSAAGLLDWLAAGGILLLFIVAISGAGRVGRPTGQIAGGRQRFHLLPDVPALRQQCFRPDQHDARLAAGLLRASAGDAGDRERPRVAARHSGRRQSVVGDRLVHRHLRGCGGVVDPRLPAADVLTSP